MRLIRDNSGASSSEYALIVAVFGMAVLLGSIAFGGAARHTMEWQVTTAPNGTQYVCTANCKYIEQDYCQAVHDHANGLSDSTFNPALPDDDQACD